MLVETDASQEKVNELKAKAQDVDALNSNEDGRSWRQSIITDNLRNVTFKRKRRKIDDFVNSSVHRNVDCSVSLKIHKQRSAPALLGAYLNIDENTTKKDSAVSKTVCGGDEGIEEDVTVDDVVAEVISGRKLNDRLRRLFQSMDLDRDGLLREDEFIPGVMKLNPELTKDEALILFHQTDTDASGSVEYSEFASFIQNTGFGSQFKMPASHRDHRGIIQIEGSKEKYFGETMRKCYAGKEKTGMDFVGARSQHLVQELYETRIASMQRFVSMCVMFHHMGKRVERFFHKISFGHWGYRMDRTHSIMRIATTASPVSGADVRQRMTHLRLLKKVQHSVNLISMAYLAYKSRKETQRVKERLVVMQLEYKVDVQHA
jgi:hypothetical protein